MSAEAVDSEKLELRKKLLAERRARGPVSPDDSMSAQTHLLKSGLLRDAKCVSIYRALPSEIATDLLAASLSAQGVVVCLPRVLDGARALEFCLASAETARGPLGIEQAKPACASLPLSQIELFVLPGLAVDPRGNRLGRGRGHYDATFAVHPKALRVGLFLEAALLERVPVGAHDVSLDAICTESRVVFCSPRSRTRAASASR